MKKIQYYISALLLVAITAMSLTSCSEDKLGPTIFPDEEEVLDPHSYSYQLDKFLKDYYLNTYNLTFLYKMPDISTNMNYNLVPATYEKSIDLAVLCRYLWFEVYDSIVGPDFLKANGPRIILLVGSPAYNPNSGSETVGLAEGGIKISLFKVNEMDLNNFYMMNEYYFHTMHHEFAHILHQKKSYPVEFNTVSVGRYDANNWQYRGNEVNSRGFVTPYASSEYREDFAETIACWITYTDAQWEQMLKFARRGWATTADEDDLDARYYSFYYYPENDPTADPQYIVDDDVFPNVDAEEKYWRNNRDKKGNRIIVYAVEDADGVEGDVAILRKLDIARKWLKEIWNVDIDALRHTVQYRQDNYDIDSLRTLVTSIPIPQ